MSGERRYRAIVEYDGTDFLGYQLQASGRTVQGEIEKSLQQVTQLAIRIDGAGRTDAGVHATGQVIAFNTIWKHSLEELHRALNATLPDDIVITNLKLVDPAFHPRFSALSRSYRYTVMNQPWVSVLERRYAYHVRKKLDVVAMQEASQLLIGSHDFASFGKPPQGENTIRQVSQAEWITNDNRLIFEITANAFLYRMVRTIVGTLIQVGSGQITVSEFKDILAARDLTRSAPPAPAHGLCLVRVTYPVEC
ncbi:MAG TPA: tRNA pseudouridine(38-40) synthase TruA [Anaerolineae bacterium]|nr:tRNA pseudouridine(38-40) synthase TruA [Anaerolineae bacterium]